MFNIIGAIISGLFIGAFAQLFYPGHQGYSWVATILLGIGGSLVAGLITSQGQRDFSRAGCLASILGAMALIFIGHVLKIGG
ncbi:GlsB/YeaQ/YmgE family stress response membrane protein [Novosphingobium naphthalenivorans]|uniref:GlsB/YeaQ/YmgE family stress response membrane protein n=1 Tax=Novosphingobium naphthalenivorans TaxID=273168 RepID=UPI00082BE35C|nr:GlsB/YeaQ/YmgE family stress response membrane protein [Novosphingobium naphthalenivorans]